MLLQFLLLLLFLLYCCHFKDDVRCRQDLRSTCKILLPGLQKAKALQMQNQMMLQRGAWIRCTMPARAKNPSSSSRFRFVAGSGTTCDHYSSSDRGAQRAQRRWCLAATSIYSARATEQR